MVAPLIGAAGISAAASLAGAGTKLYAGSLANEATAEANAVQQRQYKQQMAYKRKMDRKNIELQKQFAQQGIRWKVADAEAAGIHPLYALGAQATSYSPVSVGGPGISGPTPETGMANALAESSQDISRAIEATRPLYERDAAYDKTVRDLQITNMGLQNEHLAAQVAKLQSQVGPPGPDIAKRGLYDAIPAEPASNRKQLLPGLGGLIEPPPWVAPAKDFEDELGEEGPVARYVVPFTQIMGYGLHNANRLIQWMARNSAHDAPPPLPWWAR